MDVMTTFLPNIPEDSNERLVRTCQTEVNGMSYGIADTIGRNGYLTTLDLVLPEFRGKKDEAPFAMFGRTKAFPSNNILSKGPFAKPIQGSYLPSAFVIVFLFD
ncbi:uncharacterized protein F5891DRAFT_1258664 [Suillus fuscotomentosus]|uniref:Uncharacterized protein n=1 Tax=Suillus fuscotomentosus TaxID=1912939 RepID=A0AAD4DVW8_9AGAM|nr:uncharacterized protein F5891DRAFT_1258664 [Suillus fuscotomentosus]KAG1893583.1 hypothetical protein F5891DRAFT_1258664 [Suillus fuscotomentosus]